MNWTSATALIAALSAAGAATTYVLTRRPMGPTEIIAEVRADMDTVAFEHRTALSQLAFALAAAEDRDNKQLIAEVLTARADVHLKLRDRATALTDLQRVQSLQPNKVDLQLRIAELQSAAGETDAAHKSSLALITTSPRLAAAWELLGQLETELAVAALHPAILDIQKNLVREDAETATELLMGFSCRELGDPGLPALKYRLDAAFSNSKKYVLEEAMDTPVSETKNTPDGEAKKTRVDLAREHFAAARSAYATSVKLAPSPDRVLALSSTLTDAGQRALAIDLLHAALVVPSLSESGPIQFKLIQLLQLAGRTEEARLITRKTRWNDVVDLDHFAFAAELLYRAGDFARLGVICQQLKSLGAETERHWTRFYQSIQPIQQALKDEDPSTHEKKMLNRLKDLKAFVANTSIPEPFLGARAEANLWLAKVGLLLGDAEVEIASLREGLASMASPTADGNVQLAEALAKRSRVEWFEVDVALSNAINLEPHRHAEFTERWLEAGRKAIESRGMSVGSLIGDANRANTAVPTVSKLGPASYALLATRHLEDGRGFSALQAANRSLKEHPNLVPALDIALAAKLTAPNRYNVERDIVRRIELAGIDGYIEDCLSRIPGDRLAGDDLLAAIKTAPERFGKEAVARWFLNNGESKNARAALGGFDPRNAPDALLFLRAQTLAKEERYEAALADLTRIEAAGRLGEKAALLKALLLLELERPAGLPPIVRRLDWLEASPSTFLELADLLMSKGQADLALQIVDRLDEKASTRTPEFYRRRILVDILTSRTRGPEPAHESIERSEAYLRDGTPEIASILLAVSRRRWTELPEQIKRLRSTTFKLTPQKEVALVLLAERLEAGRRMANRGLEGDNRDAMWALLVAASDALVKDSITLPDWFGKSAGEDAQRLLLGTAGRNSRDPRETLAVLLISDLPEWGAWLLPILTKIRNESGSDIWTSYLQAVVLKTTGDIPARAAVVERLVEKYRQFGPGHQWAVQLAESAHPAEPMHPEVVRARRTRLLSLGAQLIDDPVQVALAEAGELARRNDNASAVRTLQAVLGEAGSSETEARLILGILMIRANQPSFAATFLFEAAMGEPGVFQTVVVDSLLFSIRYAMQADADGTEQRGALGRDRALEMLSSLAEEYPLDPMVALARLELSDVPRQNWAGAAKRSLDQIYKLSGRQPLETLRRGSTRPWVEFLFDVRVDLARELVDRDLVHEPGNLELWDLRAKVAEKLDDKVTAAEIYEALLVIDASSAMGYSLVEIMIERGDTSKDVNRVLKIADSAQNGGGPRSIYLSSLAESRLFQAPLPKLIKRLGSLWENRESAASEVDPVVLGELYLRVLLRRDGPEDVRAIESVQETLAKDYAGQQAYREPFMNAMEGLHTRFLQEAGTL